MDTVYVLIGKIGRSNLSTQAKKRLKSLNQYADEIGSLESAIADAEGTEKERLELEISEAQSFYNKFEEDFRNFLDDELVDFTKKQDELEQAAAEKKLEKEEAAKKLAEEEAAKLAEEEAAKLAEEEAKAAEEEAAKKLAEEEAAKREKEGNSKPESKGIGVGTIVVGTILTLATLGLWNAFRNK